MRRRAALAAAACALAGPRAARALMAGAAPDTPEARIDPNLASSPWAGVVAVRVGGGVYSGALVHPRFVLTAAHVAAGRPPAEVSIQVNAGPEARRLEAAAIRVHPGWKGFTRPFAFDDVALVELAAPAPDGVPVYRPFVGAMRAGTVLTFVGYGASGHGDRGPEVGADAAVRRVGRNRAERFVDAPGGRGRPAIFLYDFDGPDASTNAFGGPSLGNAVETSAASGDSGAPAFVRRGEFPQVAGVLTFVADYNRPGTRHATFGASGGGMLLSGVAGWLQATLAAAVR